MESSANSVGIPEHTLEPCENLLSVGGYDCGRRVIQPVEALICVAGSDTTISKPDFNNLGAAFLALSNSHINHRLSKIRSLPKTEGQP